MFCFEHVLDHVKLYLYDLQLFYCHVFSDSNHFVLFCSEQYLRVLFMQNVSDELQHWLQMTRDNTITIAKGMVFTTIDPIGETR